MNEGELIEWIVAEEKKKAQEATYPQKGQKGFQPSVTQIFVEHKPSETIDIVAAQVGLGSIPCSLNYVLLSTTNRLNG